VFLFSDHLGNHQVIVAADLVNSLDQAFIQGYYFNNKNRISLGVGGFHTKNYYEDSYNFLFSDRFYGVQGFASRPFSTFSRIEASLAQVFIDRKYYDRVYGDLRPNRSSQITSMTGSYVFDNVLWGYTAPVNGRRFKVTLDAGINLFDSQDINFYSGAFDYRRYWHFGQMVSMAVRFSGGASFGRTPKQYFVGGTTNFIGTRTLEAKVYDVENLYFADVVTPSLPTLAPPGSAAISRAARPRGASTDCRTSRPGSDAACASTSLASRFCATTSPGRPTSTTSRTSPPTTSRSAPTSESRTR
jgi:hypothetical protein